jgi:hypothetical protein
VVPLPQLFVISTPARFAVPHQEIIANALETGSNFIDAKCAAVDENS